MTLKEQYPDPVLELGGGMRLRFTERSDSDDYCGGIFEHPSASSPSGECSGAIWFKGHGGGHPEWDVLSEKPLTLAPSLLCHCGYHGFIQAGKWVSA